MPAVLVQDRFVSTVYWGYTIIVSHVLVTLSVFSWIGDEQNLWFVSVTRRRDARDDTHHSFCVVTLDSAGHWTQPLALVRVYIVWLVVSWSWPAHINWDRKVYSISINTSCIVKMTNMFHQAASICRTYLCFYTTLKKMLYSSVLCTTLS